MGMDGAEQTITEVVQAITEGQAEELSAKLEALQNAPNTHDSRQPLLKALQRVLSGEHDPTLADDPNLTYLDAVELRLLLEGLSTLTPNPSPS